MSARSWYWGTMTAMKPAVAGSLPNPSGRRGAIYRRIADDLLQRIGDGEWPPGAKLPTEQQLMDYYGASSTTVRQAVKAMAAAGVIETRHGAGSFVVERKLLSIFYATYTEDLDRREGITTQDSWSTDVLDSGRQPHQRLECLNVPATPEVAKILAVEPDEALVMRRLWRSVDGIPASIETSLFPRWLVDELPELASPHDIAQGTTSYVAEHGHLMTLHQDHLSARPFTREEANFFDAPPGVMALVRTRVSFEEPGGLVLRHMDTVYRSDMHEIVYDVPGRGNRRPT
jgi:GntR family transcriptional regulator